MEKRNSQLEHGQPMKQTRACFSLTTQVLLAVNHNTSVTSGECRQVSLAAVNQIYVVHEAMNGCTLKVCFENVNIGLCRVVMMRINWSGRRIS